MKIIKTSNLIPINKSKTQICLVKRYMGDNLHGKWTFPGQSKKKEETSEESIKRIIKEEFNTEISNLSTLNTYESKTKNAVIKSTYFLGEIKNTTQLSTKKYTEIKWFNLDEEIYFQDFLFNEKDIIAELFKKLK